MQILTVSQLNSYLRELLAYDEILQDLWVEGEVSNFARAASGHCYFTLKEGEGQIKAVCWRSQVARIPVLPNNGNAVLVHGNVAFYEAGGQIQLYVDMIRPAGVGLLHARFEELKTRLDAEGLFDQSRKRVLPAFPRRIGLVTSPRGAALHDILTVLGRRYPVVEVLISPCMVQGDGAAETIVEALYRLYDEALDLIIVARGGGSLEDLWAFNEEIVARAVFASPVPVISGVGHETDTTMIDYVADLRAPTPSAAAELSVPDVQELSDAVGRVREHLTQVMRLRVERSAAALQEQMRRHQQLSPAVRLRQDRQVLDEWSRRATARMVHMLALQQAHLDGKRRHLAALDPHATLGRGYAIVRRASDGQVVTAPEQVGAGDALDITVKYGQFSVRLQ